MQHVKTSIRCVRAPVDFEDIPLSSNVANDEMKLIDGCREVAAEYPDIKFDIMIINNTCMQLVNRPTQFDVMVTTNLYENMISNVCAGLVAGSKYGKYIANPSGILFAVANMLKYLGLDQHCSTIRNAVLYTIQEHKIKTADIGSTSTTTQFIGCALNGIVKMTSQIVFNYEITNIYQEIEVKQEANQSDRIDFDTGAEID
ncbi:unnamed protein product [Rotaria magnacalcarata]|uniref:isocitrate dehydrogenase (NAD(+)) n=1 Tax=Rotaria magnacalcarata TaxID=392030 RepID=A0A8S2Q6N1_9BILA|nr:unnamed protein product [Rotaria magnacalcarata]